MSKSALHRLTTSQTPLLRRSNPHSQRGLITRSPSAVSSLGGFRTPAPQPAAPHSLGRHPKTFTTADIGRRGPQVAFVPGGDIHVNRLVAVGQQSMSAATRIFAE